jgi:hypothetical protein
MTACAHRWLTAGGERRDSCGECGVFATEVLATLTPRLAAAEGEWMQAQQTLMEYRDQRDQLTVDLQRVRGALEELTYGRLLKLTKGNGTSEIYEAIQTALTGTAPGEGT